MEITTVPLPPDGADYVCGVHVFIPREPFWRCPKAATKALPGMEEVEILNEIVGPTFKVYTRAICDNHLDMFEREN